jgi:hypothetical protein
MPLHRHFAGLLVATLCPSSLAAQHITYDSTAQAWTLTSGPVSYRLVRHDQQVAFDYFGPTSRMSAAPDTAQPARADLTGLLDDQSLDSAFLRLVSDSAVQPSPGVEELRLQFVHASLPLQVDVLRLPAIWRAGVVELEAQAATHSPS